MPIVFFYFFIKIFLFISGYIKFDTINNVSYLLFMTITVLYIKNKNNVKSIKYIRNFIGFFGGLFIFWYDTWLPSPMAAYKMLSQWGLPSGNYIIEFVSRYFDIKILLLALGLLVFSIIIKKFIKIFSVIILLVILVLPIFNKTETLNQEELQNYLETFYNNESSKKIILSTNENIGLPFDIIFINICSLSWSDIKATGLENHILFKKFDYLFTNFNSVASYSNPSVIRLFYSTVGQMRHSEMYSGLSKEESMFNILSSIGYKTFFVMNHDGIYGNFEKETKELGNFPGETLKIEHSFPEILMFDGSPVYNNLDTLRKTMKIREDKKVDKAAIYYNTVSLHDGCKFVDKTKNPDNNEKKLYKTTLKQMLDEFVTFFEEIDKSGKRVVLVFVPEHGRALVGNSIQMAGLRDIPLKSITNVPLGIRISGPKNYQKEFQQTIIDKPTSYFAIGYIIKSFIINNPYISSDFYENSFIYDIPETEFVAENENNIVIEKDNRYYNFGKEKRWIPLELDKEK